MTLVFILLCKKNYNKNISYNALNFCRKFKFKNLHSKMQFSGQRFALLEEKAVLSTVLRKFKLESLDRREDIDLMFQLILKPKHGLRIKITPR
jgi:hypothetical protein